MKHKGILGRLVVLTLAVVFLISGCSSGGTKNEQTGTNNQTPPIANQAQPATNSIPGAQIITTDKASSPTGPFSQAVKIGDFVFVSGMRGIDPKTNNLVTGDTRAKVKQAFENIKAILEAAGTSMENVVSTKVFVRDMFQDRPVVNDLYKEYFGDKFPPRTIVEISRLNQDDEVEIDVIAWVPDGNNQKPQVISTDKAAKPTGPFSQAVKAGDFVFVAGQRGIEPGTGNLKTTTEEKTKQAFENIKNILEAAGTSLDNVVFTQVFVRDMFRDRPVVNKMYEQYFGTKFPPRTIVEVNRLNQDDEVEIEVIAWVPNDKNSADKPQIIFTDKAAKPTGPFSQAVKAGNYVFVAGQRGIEPGTSNLKNNIEDKTKQTFENIDTILKAAGGSARNIVSTHVFVRDMFRYRPVVNKYYEQYFGKAFPTRTIVEVQRLNQNDDLEIEAIAYIPKK